MRRSVKLLVVTALLLAAAPFAAFGLLRFAVAALDDAEPPPCVLAIGLVPDSTANAACLVDDGERLLLVRTLRSGNWGLPGGRRRSGEPSQCTAHRETWEETGFLVEVGPLAATTDSTRIYRCSADADPPQHFDGPRPWLSQIEILDQAWVPKTELESLEWRYPDQKAVVARLLAGSGELGP